MQAELVKFLSTKENYDAYHKYVRDDVLAPEVAESIKIIGELFKTNPTLTAVDFNAARPFFVMRATKVKGVMLDKLLDSFAKADPDSYSVNEIVGEFIKLDYSNQIVDAIMKAEGKPDPLALKSKVEEMIDTLSGVEKGDKHIIEFSLSTLVSTFVRSGGYSWRLDFLNRAIGPISPGDLVVVGARPESGKTSFITSEVSHMMTQLRPDEGIVIFNNEEKGDKVLGRFVQSTLGITGMDIASNPAKSEADFLKLAGRKDKVVVFNKAHMSVYDVERQLRSTKARIVVFNTLAKVRGFKDAGSEVARLEHLYQWARYIASDYNCVVFVVAQADATAENVKYIYQDQLYNSKTAIQGEADVLITIGKMHGVDDKRWLNIPKNKIPPTPGVDPLLSHGKEEVNFDGTTGRFY